MVEKDFRKIVTEVEIKPEKRSANLQLFDELSTLFKEHLSSNLQFRNMQMIGAWAKGTALHQDVLEFLIEVDQKQEFPYFLATKAIDNEIENALIYGIGSDILGIERTEARLKVELKDNIKMVLLINQPNASLQIKFVELANQEFTYFKNTMKIIKWVVEDLNLKQINDYLLEVILYYSLVYYKGENKYYGYLGALAKGFDDFFNGISIEVPNAMLEKLGKASVEKPPHKYIVFDPTNPETNLAEFLTDLNIGDYRKLKKRIAKLIENTVEDRFLFDQSLEVIIDVNPVIDKPQDKYQWQYYVVGKNLTNRGGLYDKTEPNFHTAILKGIFKGFKALEANGLLKKKIILQCDYEGILEAKMLTSEENKSRMKTIQAFIKEKKLNVSTTLGKIAKE